MTTPMSELNPNSVSRSDRERFRDILAVQRAAYLREGAPSLTRRRGEVFSSVVGGPSTLSFGKRRSFGRSISGQTGEPDHRASRAWRTGEL
jgi:hypothetical protein